METTLNSIDDKRLYKFAWFFEIFAVLIGVYLAISLSIGGISSEPQTQDWINFGGIILILLFGAFIELTKIPIIMAFHKARSSYRKIFMLLLFIFLCLFTFDTLFQSTEQFINFREKPIEEKRIGIKAAEEERDIIITKIAAIRLPSDKEIAEQFNNSFNEQAKTYDNDIARLDAEKAKLENPTDTPEIAQLKQQRDMLIQDKNKAMENFQAAKKEYTEQLSILVNGSRKAQRRIPALEKKWAEESTEYSKDMNQRAVIIGVVDLRIQELIKIQVAPNQIKINAIESDLKKIRSAKAELLKSSRKGLDVKIAQVLKNRGELKNLKTDKELLDDRYQKLRNELHVFAHENNIYRIGQRFYGKEHPADLTKEEIALITLFLMITTASIFTLVGPGCAYFSLTENAQKEKESKHQKGMLMKSVRSLLIHLRKKVREPKIVKQIEEVEVLKEVYKEVPVEKTVIKEVEVPKPYEVTRYIGIPVPKDPEDLIEINNAEELDLTTVQALQGSES